MCLVLVDYIVELVEKVEFVGELFDYVVVGCIRIEIYQCYVLEDVVQVYCDLELCKMMGLFVFVI